MWVPRLRLRLTKRLSVFLHPSWQQDLAKRRRGSLLAITRKEVRSHLRRCDCYSLACLASLTTSSQSFCNGVCSVHGRRSSGPKSFGGVGGREIGRETILDPKTDQGNHASYMYTWTYSLVLYLGLSQLELSKSRQILGQLQMQLLGGFGAIQLPNNHWHFVPPSQARYSTSCSHWLWH